MKNVDVLITEAGETIANFASGNAGPFDLFFIDGIFVCASKTVSANMPYFIRHISLSQKENGLTASQWLKVGRKAHKLLKESS